MFQDTEDVEEEEEMFDAIEGVVGEDMEGLDEPQAPEAAALVPAPAPGALADRAEEPELSETESTDEETENFDISLAASHSYMGAGLQPVRGRSVLEAGWEGAVPVLAHHGAVFPGETVPMLLTNTHDASMVLAAIASDKLFGLLCPDESGTLVSGYGVLCEVFEAARTQPASPAPLTFKARANHRFRFLHMPKQALPMNHYTSTDRRLRMMDAAGACWPLFVYEIFDYGRMRAIIQDYFDTIMLGDKLPEEPVSLSFWVARNLALAPRDRLALFVVDNALLRLHMAVRDICRKSVLCCASCANEIARRDHIFAMSSEGVHSNYTNPGGYMHDIVTVSRAVNTELTGAPSAEFSWFPGYTWTIAMCSHCMAHIGWRFDAEKRSLRPQQFYGLCRNYVTPRAADAAPLPPLAPFRLASPAPALMEP